jgi:hypothetical protein
MVRTPESGEEQDTYFAYGTLLDSAYIRQYCPTAVSVGLMRLDGYELDFATCADGVRGGCTLKPVPGAELWGVQYQMSAADFSHLKDISGIDTGDWACKDVIVKDMDGSRVETTTFVIPNPAGSYAPPDSYVAPIYSGAAKSGLPEHYISRLNELVKDAQQRRD